MPATRTPSLPAAIADHMEAHGIEGLQIGSRTITAAELREHGRPPGIADLNELWAAAHVGQRFKRPKGRTVYLLTGYRWEYYGWRNILQGEVRTFLLDGSETTAPLGVAISDLRRMDLVD